MLGPKFVAVLGVFAAAAAPTQPAPKILLPPSVKKDVQCFLLYAVAVDRAENAKNDKGREAAGMGLLYFLGKLRVGAPGLNLGDAVRQEARGMEGNSEAKAIGAACDAEFTKQGVELQEMGKQLQNPGS